MEDFVSFEIAKKLKEKGFNVSCIYAYCKQGGWNKYTQKHEPITYILRTDGNPFGTYYIGKNWNKEYKINKNKIQCSAPTISQVLKWLREEKKIHISLCRYKDDNISFAGWFYLIVEMGDSIWKYHDQEPQRDNSTATYESVAIDAIKYVLDNLI